MKNYGLTLSVIAAIALTCYLIGYAWFRNDAFMYRDLDGNDHFCIIKEFRNSSLMTQNIRSFARLIYAPLLWIDQKITGRELEDEM